MVIENKVTFWPSSSVWKIWKKLESLLSQPFPWTTAERSSSNSRSLTISLDKLMDLIPPWFCATMADYVVWLMPEWNLLWIRYFVFFILTISFSGFIVQFRSFCVLEDVYFVRNTIAQNLCVLSGLKRTNKETKKGDPICWTFREYWENFPANLSIIILRHAAGVGSGGRGIAFALLCVTPK